MQIALWIAAGAVFLGAFVYRSVKPDKVAPAWGLFAAGAALAVAALVVPNFGGGTDAKVSFVTPKDGDVVPAGRAVEVQIDLTGGELATSPTDTTGGHIHVFVDGSVISMPFGDTSEVTLEPGEHELKVEYVDLQHASFDPPVQQTVTVTAKRGA